MNVDNNNIVYVFIKLHMAEKVINEESCYINMTEELKSLPFVTFECLQTTKSN